NWSSYGIDYLRFDVSSADVQSILIREYGGNYVVFEFLTINQPTTVDGGQGNDWLVTGAGSDVVTDLFGQNRIYTGLGDDVVTTGSGDDRIWTDGGNDLVDA